MRCIHIIKDKYDKIPVQAKASFWFLICSFLTKGISILTTPIFTRLMSTSEYGKFGVFISWQGILTVFLTLNMFSGVYVNGIAKFKKDSEAYVGSLLGLSFTLMLVWMTIFVLFRDVLLSITSLSLFQLICLCLMTWENAVFQAWSVRQRSELKYSALIAITVFVAVFRPLLGVLFVVCLGGTATARIVSMTIVDVFVYSGLFVLLSIRGRKLFNWYYWIYTLKRNIPLIPHYLSLTILTSADRIMISRMIDNSASGIYNLAYQIAMIMNFFNTALMQTLEPWIYEKLKKHDYSEISAILNITSTGMAGVLFLAIFVAPEMLKIFAPPQYYTAVYVIPPVMLSVFFMFLYMFFVTYEFHKEKSNFITIASCFGALMNVILNYIFIDIFGYVAAGYTTLVCYIFFAVGHYLFSTYLWKRDYGRESMYNIKFIITLSTVLIFSGFVLTMLYNHPFVRYLLFGLVCIFLYYHKGKIKSYVMQILKIRRKM